MSSGERVDRWQEIEALAIEAGMVQVETPDAQVPEAKHISFASPGKPGVTTMHLYKFAELVAAYLGKQGEDK